VFLACRMEWDEGDLWNTGSFMHFWSARVRQVREILTAKQDLQVPVFLEAFYSSRLKSVPRNCVCCK